MTGDLLERGAEFVNGRLSAAAGVERVDTDESQTFSPDDGESIGAAAVRMMRVIVGDLVALEDVEPLMATLATDARHQREELPSMTAAAGCASIAVTLAKSFALGHYVGRNRTPAVSLSVLERVVAGELRLEDVVADARGRRA